MTDKRFNQRERMGNLIVIAEKALPKYEIRGVFRMIEETPAGNKCKYLETEIGAINLECLFGGILLACPKGDRSNGRYNLEISTRDQSIKVSKYASSSDAQILSDAYKEKGFDFKIIV